MTLTMFITLFTALSTVASLFTEAIKKNFNVKNYTLIVLIVSAVIGWGGGAITYCFMKVPFDNVSNILCLFLLAPSIWLGATLGYDKVKEIIAKIGVTA